ncbi:MAG: PilN domain-containing protein [Candidatus Omnitrophica bacterium]|nr:PilN domain-containing protein [Candidatus Omnitrophota bacterium]
MLGIPTSASVVTTVHPLVVTRDHEQLAVQFELQQHLPYDVSGVVWHYRWFTGNGQTPPAAGRRRAETPAPPRPAVVAAAKQSILDERLAACRRAGIAVREVGVAAVSLVNAWSQQLSPGEPSFGVLLHVDEGLVEWVITSPSGVYVFTTFQNLEAAAQEQWLATLKSSWTNLHESLGVPALFGGGGAAPPLWVFGGPVSLTLLAQDLKRELNCPVSILDPARIAAMEAMRPADAHPLVVGMGLALQGLGSARLAMNLLSEVTRRQRAAQIRQAAGAVCGLLAAAVVWLGAAGMVSVLRDRQGRLAKLTAQEQTYQMMRPEVRAQLKRQARFEDRLSQLQDVALGRSRLAQVFEQLVGVMPDEIWLAKLELSKDVPRPAGAAQGAGTMDGVVEGYARSFQGVTVFMDRLKSLAGWTTVKPLGTTVTTDPATGKELVAFMVQVQRPMTPPASEASPERSRGTAEEASPDAAASR